MSKVKIKAVDDDLRPTCARCVFYVAEPKDALGFCHRYPPTFVSDGEGTDSMFAVTEPGDWCGEFIRKLQG